MDLFARWPAATQPAPPASQASVLAAQPEPPAGQVPAGPFAPAE